MNNELRKIKPIKKSPSEERFFSVDPARLALALLLVKGRILLHKLQARIHGFDFSMLKIKNKIPAKRRLYLTSSEPIIYMNPTFSIIISAVKIMSRVIANYQLSLHRHLPRFEVVGNHHVAHQSSYPFSFQFGKSLSKLYQVCCQIFSYLYITMVIKNESMLIN